MTLVRWFVAAVLAISGFWVCYNIRQGSLNGSAIGEEYLRRVFTDDLGYTLVGAKPASLDDSCTYYLRMAYPEDVEKARLFLKSTFAHSKRFILREIDNDLWLINKQSLSIQISKHIELKSFIINKFKNKKEFFRCLKTSDTTLFEALDDRCDLIAIALGYGRDNGEYYSRRLELGRHLHKYPIVSHYPFNGCPMVGDVQGCSGSFDLQVRKHPAPEASSAFLSFEDEWQWVRQVEWPLYKDDEPAPPFYISMPTYIARHSPESEKVHARYLKAKDKLAKLFCSRKISEVVAEEAKK
jgi:hypothetical protein